jgi:hypothetical protein
MALSKNVPVLDRKLIELNFAETFGPYLVLVTLTFSLSFRETDNMTATVFWERA